MRESVQVTKGQKFASKYYPDQKLATVRGVETADGVTYVIYERDFKGTYGNARKTIESLDKGSFLSEYKEKEEFFVVGGQYKSVNGLTYYIQEIFTISTPISANYRKQARAVIIDDRGRRWMEMLNIGDFKYVKRVK